MIVLVIVLFIVLFIVLIACTPEFIFGRNLRNVAGRVYIWRMQSEATDPTDIPRERLRRPEAADYCQRRLGQSVKPNTLRGWAVPYRQLGRDAVYEVSDLDRFIDARLAAADVRLAGRPPGAGAKSTEPA